MLCVDQYHENIYSANSMENETINCPAKVRIHEITLWDYDV